MDSEDRKNNNVDAEKRLEAAITADFFEGATASKKGGADSKLASKKAGATGVGAKTMTGKTVPGAKSMTGKKLGKGKDQEHGPFSRNKNKDQSLRESSLNENMLDGADGDKAAMGEGDPNKLNIESIAEEENGIEYNDDGWLSDLDIDEITKRKVSVDAYNHSCKVLGIVPVSYFAKRLNSDQIIMRYHGLGAKGAQAISEVLGYNNTILHLDLTGNACGAGGYYIGKCLQNNQTLVHLDLSHNNLGEQGVEDFAEMLSENSTLKTLILKGNKLTDNEACHIAAGLKKNSSLTVLDISHNYISDIGAIELGSGVGNAEALKEVNIGWNNIRPRGMIGFLNGAKDNVGLIGLNLENNGIGDSASGLALLMQKNPQMIILNIARTRLTDVGVQAMVKAIESANALREFDVSDNVFTDQGAALIFKGLGSSNIKKLVMRNVRVSRQTREKLEELRAQKPELIVIE